MHRNFLKVNTCFKYLMLTVGLISLTACNNMVSQEVYRDTKNQLDRARQEIEEKQLLLEKAQRETQEKQAKVDELKSDIDALRSTGASNQRATDELKGELTKRNEDLKVVGACLQGVVNAISYSEDNQAAALFEIAAVARECKQSQSIVDGLEGMTTGFTSGSRQVRADL